MSQKRQFPKFYEKAVPIILVLIGIAVLVILLLITGLATDLISSGI